MAALREISRPTIRPHKTWSRSIEPDFPPGAAGINEGMPYLRGMLSSMFGHNRKDAIEYGEAALELLPEA